MSFTSDHNERHIFLVFFFSSNINLIHQASPCTQNHFSTPVVANFLPHYLYTECNFSFAATSTGDRHFGMARCMILSSL